MPRGKAHERRLGHCEKLAQALLCAMDRDSQYGAFSESHRSSHRRTASAYLLLPELAVLVAHL